jgi:hypothetical protein
MTVLPFKRRLLQDDIVLRPDAPGSDPSSPPRQSSVSVEGPLKGLVGH